MAPDARARPAAATPPAAEPAPKTGQPDRQARSGPVPPAGVHERRSRRHADRSRPPKFVRNFLKALGFR